MRLAVCFVVVLMGTAIAATSSALGQTKQDATVNQAAAVLNEIMSLPAKRIPGWLLKDAQAIAIIPNVVKGGFVIGGRHGRGVVLIRDDKGAWHPPAFISLTGGSVGFQAGLQSTDVVLVFKTRKSVDGLLSGKFTIGVDAAAAAGPVGRQAAAATDGKLKAEIYSYSRSRGLFAGVSLDGSVLQVDNAADAAYYASRTPGQPEVLPAAANKLMQTVAAYAAESDGQAAAEVPTEARPTAFAPATTSRFSQSLAAAWQAMTPLLDDRWKSYLALPAFVYERGAEPNLETLSETLARYETVAANPTYRSLTGRREFQLTHQWLRAYVQELQAENSTELALPPPPM